MKPVYDYIIKPLGKRYNNSVEVADGKSLIVNTEIFNHGYITVKLLLSLLLLITYITYRKVKK